MGDKSIDIFPVTSAGPVGAGSVPDLLAAPRIDADDWAVVERIGLKELPARLEDFFKASPWRVEVKKSGGKLWYKWQRFFNVGKKEPVASPIFTLVPVDEKNLPIIYKSTIPFEPDILLIPLPDTMILPYFDPQDHMLKNLSEGGGSKEYEMVTDRTHYLAIPARPLSDSAAIVLEIDGYWEWDGDYKRGPFHNKYKLHQVWENPPDDDIWAMISSERHEIIFGHGYSEETRLIQRKRKESRFYQAPAATGPAGRQAPAPFCAIYDTSGSMGSFRVHPLMASSLASWLIEAKPDKKHLRELYAKGGINAVINELTHMIRPVRMFLVDGGIYGVRSALFPITDGIDVGKLEEWLKTDGIDVRLSDAIPLYGREGVERLLEEGFERLAMGADVFINNDVDGDALASVKESCKDGRDYKYIYITDNGGDIAAVPPAVVVEHGKSGVGIPAVSEENILEASLSSGVPLFISVVLARDFLSAHLSQAASDAIGEADKVKLGQLPKEVARLKPTYIYHIIPKLADLAAGERAPWYNTLKSVIEDRAHDTQLKRRAIALLAVWHLKGDAEAGSILRSLFTSPEALDLGSRLYLAKVMTLFLGKEEAAGILEKIKSDPVDKLNPYYLTALAGSAEFPEALEFILDRVWDPKMIYNPEYGDLSDALSVTFKDPLVRYKAPAKLSQEVLRKVAGSPWGGEELQRIYELYNQKLLPVFEAATRPNIGLVAGYARSFLRPEMVKGTRVQLNPVPVRSFWYELPLGEAEKEIQSLVRDAAQEEAWLHVQKGKGGYLFENGVIQSEDTAMSIINWDVIKEKVGGGGEMVVTHIHIHPPRGSSYPERVLAFPSDADFLSGWFGTMVGVRARHPGAKVQFHVVSPEGVTTVVPTEALLEMVDRLIEKDRDDLDSVEVPKDYKERVGEYISYIREVLDYAQSNRVRETFHDYFEITVPPKKDRISG